jgi:ABC-type cobalamin/Fe3+-siderophores transport system ATPase subunit
MKNSEFDSNLSILRGVNQILLSNWGAIDVRAKIFEKYSKVSIERAIAYFKQLEEASNATTPKQDAI